jgi:hypothetical protein
MRVAWGLGAVDGRTEEGDKKKNYACLCLFSFLQAPFYLFPSQHGHGNLRVADVAREFDEEGGLGGGRAGEGDGGGGSGAGASTWQWGGAVRHMCAWCGFP